MHQNTLLIPFFGMMLLTIAVWFYMYYQRLSYILVNKIDAQQLATSDEVKSIIPEKINLPAENLANLFELPVLFYAICLYLYLSDQVSILLLALAYLFLVTRCLHSLIHCTYNKVMHRFLAYIASSMLLWVMIGISLVTSIST